jgi:hypothetical protein
MTPGRCCPTTSRISCAFGIEDNLSTLGIERLTAVNLRLMDNAVPDNRFVDQLGAMIQARDEGLIAGIGLSNISLAHLLRAPGVHRNRLCAKLFQPCRFGGETPPWSGTPHPAGVAWPSAVPSRKYGLALVEVSVAILPKG